MVKMAFVAPFIAVMLFSSFVSPILNNLGVDPFARARSQTASVEHRIYAALRWEPNIKWDFWR